MFHGKKSCLPCCMHIFKSKKINRRKYYGCWCCHSREQDLKSNLSFISQVVCWDYLQLTHGYLFVSRRTHWTLPLPLNSTLPCPSCQYPCQWSTINLDKQVSWTYTIKPRASKHPRKTNTTSSSTLMKQNTVKTNSWKWNFS